MQAEEPTGVIVFADEKVAALHGLPLEAPHLLLAGGEESKTLVHWQRALDALVESGLDRDGIVVALGGGVVLDLVGYAAASYLRGVRWIAAPSTLLAQVDAAHGGKTGVDHPAAKNLVGAFHMPVAVVVDTDLLATLPERETRGGLAEVVKHAIIGAPELLERCGRDDPAAFVADAAQVKLDVVARDPHEKGERRHLNLGHTLGHAVERAGGYALHHGEAVAVGLRAACHIAERHCGFKDSNAVNAALDRCGLPSRADAQRDDVVAALRHDKKRKGKKLRWVLPLRVGEVKVFDDVPDELVSTAVDATLVSR